MATNGKSISELLAEIERHDREAEIERRVAERLEEERARERAERAREAERKMLDVKRSTLTALEKVGSSASAGKIFT